MLWGIIVFTAACGGRGGDGGSTMEAGADTAGMEQFAGDESFRAMHEEPAALPFRGRGSMVTFDTPDGRQGSAYAMMPEGPTGRYLFVIHEWWGLNDHIKAETERLFDVLGAEVAVLALDLYEGRVAGTQEKAAEYVAQVDDARAESVVKGAVAFAGPRAEIATIGWCFGGGWSLRAAILAGDQARGCVMYYGMPVQAAETLAPLKCQVLGIFARKDMHINEEVIGKFEDLAQETGKNLEVHWFDADHAFANPSSPRYAEEAARQANQLAWNFLKEIW